MAAKKIRNFKKLLKETKELKDKVKKLDIRIFKMESCYLGSIPNNPITRDADYYTQGIVNKNKRGYENTRDRIFSKNYPK